ncbi:hypothetical protein HIM_03937 [Hirsutella minnesotensis 3608]|uniref:Glutaredoxin-like protein n=1 Tax=Hirsutella minnesotensis 3608 TaxID=1043627 RepID=A0A0F7ZLP9_9HYPO|nr:hypothetical protein HIM_03937 [Hirsutella minnesotensis 3608]
MFTSRRLLQACRITLFTRDNCGLCTAAKDVLSTVQAKRPFELQQVDLSLSKSKPWRDVYDFDIPVIHVSKATAKEEQVGSVGKAVKLMHRFTPEQVEAKMDEVERS